MTAIPVTSATLPDQQAALAVRRAGRGRMLRDLTRRPLAVAAAAWLLLVVVSAAAAPVLAPAGPETEDLAHVRSGPSAAHWLGTDRLGSP